MLHIILMILKILGILILIILGLLLCIGLLVLFCPVRYYLEGSVYGKPKGYVRVSWLLRFISATFSYNEKRFECKICILGILLKKKKKASQAEAKAESKVEKKRFHFFAKRKKDQRVEEKKAGKEIGQTAEEADKKPTEALEKEKGESEANQKKSKKDIRKEEKKEKEKQAQQEKTNQKERKEVQQEETNRKEIEEIQQKKADRKEAGEAEQKILQIEEQAETPQETGKQKNGWQLFKNLISGIKNIPVKIKGIFTKIKEIFTKITDILSEIKAKIQKFLAFLCDLYKKEQTVLAFIRDEKNKMAFRYARGKLFKLFCYVLPRKVTLKLHYGFEDPAATGMLTGMIFMFYPESAEKFQLMPDFEKQVLEGELTIKGRVRLIRVLCTLISIYFHKECNRIIKMILKR